MNLPPIPSTCCSWASFPFPLAHLYTVMSLISLQSPPHIYFVPRQPRGSGMAWQWWVNVLGTLVLTSGSVTSPSPSSSASPLGANHRTSSATHSHCSGLGCFQNQPPLSISFTQPLENNLKSPNQALKQNQYAQRADFCPGHTNWAEPSFLSSLSSVMLVEARRLTLLQLI